MSTLFFPWMRNRILNIEVYDSKDDISRYPSQPGFLVCMQVFIAELREEWARNEFCLISQNMNALCRSVGGANTNEGDDLW
jgi:hypothetical protein